jgi:hypothetical protein
VTPCSRTSAVSSLRAAAVSPDRPAWVHDDWTVDTGAARTLWWLHCGDIALPLGGTVGGERLLATTVLTRGGISDVARRGRNLKRSTRTWGARKTNRSKPPGGRPDPTRPTGDVHSGHPNPERMMPSTKAAAKTDLQAANLNPYAAQAVAGGQNVFVQLNYAERVAEPAGLIDAIEGLYGAGKVSSDGDVTASSILRLRVIP